MAKGPSPIVQLRRLFTEMSKLMPSYLTFREIAYEFYEVGLIDTPESPYETGRWNYKSEYVMQKLNDALHDGRDFDDFLRVTVPKVVCHVDVEGEGSVASIEPLLRQMGYRVSVLGEVHGVADYDAPDEFSLTRLGQEKKSEDNPPKRVKHIDVPGLPASVQALVDELDGCMAAGYLNASALLTRRIIKLVVFVAMAKRGQQARLLDDGKEVGLATAINRCANEYSLSKQKVDRITTAKWIGDEAHHGNPHFKVTESDLDKTLTGVRLFMQAVLASDDEPGSPTVSAPTQSLGNVA